MIKLKLASLAEKYNKNITEISQSAGLNRNAVTALIHNKVNGIKFSTLESLCSLFDCKIEDLLELEKKETRENDNFFYRQEVNMLPFYMYIPVKSINLLAQNFSSINFGSVYMYIKSRRGYIYWNYPKLNIIAKRVYEYYLDKEKWKKIKIEYSKAAKQIEDIYYSLDEKDALGFNKGELLDLFKRVEEVTIRFWQNSLFIDSFDPGFDRKEIRKIAGIQGFKNEEIVTLLTSEKTTFNKERLFDLLKIVNNKKNLKAKQKLMVEFLRNYRFYKTDFTGSYVVSVKEIDAEITKYVNDKKMFNQQYKELKNYSFVQKKKISKVLKKYKLAENPLQFFNELSGWREDRKRINMISIYILSSILNALEKQTGIAKKYLEYLSLDEIDNLYKGLIGQEVLEKRMAGNVMIEIQGSDYKFVIGEEADLLKKNLDKNLHPGKDQVVFYGTTACPGYVRGLAKVIKNPAESNLDDLKENTILICNQGNIGEKLIEKVGGVVLTVDNSNYPAIESAKKYNKPCVYGLTNILNVVQNGEMVELRANHGTVRVIK